MGSTTFSLDPLLKATLPKAMALSVFEDMDYFLRAFFIFIALSITYPITHKILQRSLTVYNDLAGTAKQVTVLHHFLEGVILTTITPFLSYFIFRINFVSHEESKDDLEVLGEITGDLRRTFLLCLCIMIMYLFELASRFQSPRAILFFHHLLAVLDGYLVLVFPTTVMLKTCSTLVYFICFEAVTFIGLFMYRAFPLSKFTPHVIMTGIVIFTATRPIQVLWIGAAAFGTWNEPNHDKWQAVMQFSLTCLFTALQLWSTKINLIVWKRCKDRIKKHSQALDQAKTSDWMNTSSDDDDDVESNSWDWLESAAQAVPITTEDAAVAKNDMMPKECQVGLQSATEETLSQQNLEMKSKQSSTRQPSVCILPLILLLLLASIIAVTITPATESTGSFLDFATKELEGIKSEICEADDFSDICSDIDELRSAGEKYEKALPRHYHLNYQAMAMAYTMIPELLDPDEDEDSRITFLRANYFLQVLRIHRTLGLGNSLRLQGHSEGMIDKAYWDHHDLLLLQDGNLQPAGDGIESLCEYISFEYESLKAFASKNFDETFALSETFVTVGPGTEYSSMYKTCTSDNTLLSYLVRNDWEHHHREATSSLMKQKYTEKVVTHTIWHWESLFALFVAPDTAIPMMMKSFDALLVES